MLVRKSYEDVHLGNTRSRVSSCIVYFDFSIAFYTIQLHLLTDKLMTLNVIPHNVIRWTLEYRTDRSQFVRLNIVIKEYYYRIRVPPRYGVAPILFTVYTSDMRPTSSESSTVKFTDDTALVLLAVNNDDSMYLDQLNRFVACCD